MGRDDVEDIKRLRDEYESALDEADTRRAEYHRAIKKLHLSGVPLREIADQLGLSHQRVHQIVTGEVEQPKKRKVARGVVAALVVLAAIGAGTTAGLVSRGGQRPVAQPIGSNLIAMPKITGLSVPDAQRLLALNDLCVTQITASGTGEPSDAVDAQSPVAGTLLTKGATASVEVPGPERGFSFAGVKVPLTVSKAQVLPVDRPPASCGGRLNVFRVTLEFHDDSITLREGSGRTVYVYSSSGKGPDLTHFAA